MVGVAALFTASISGIVAPSICASWVTVATSVVTGVEPLVSMIVVVSNDMTLGVSIH